MRNLIKAGATIALVLSGLAPVAASALDDKTADRAMAARQGFMQTLSWEAGPLFGMAKGDIAYDGDEAARRAASLKALVAYDPVGAYLEGTSKADRPGKTRALPAIWAEPEKIGEAYEALRAAVDGVAEKAADGPEALGGAVAALGKACGGCHESFRADDF